eukprot:126426_1
MRFVPSTNDVKDISSQSKEIISKIQKKRIKRNYNLKTSTISQMVMRLIKSQLIHAHLLCSILAIMNIYVSFAVSQSSHIILCLLNQNSDANVEHQCTIGYSVIFIISCLLLLVLAYFCVC